MAIRIENRDPAGTEGRRLQVVRLDEGYSPVVVATLAGGETFDGYVWQERQFKLVELIEPVEATEAKVG